MSFFSDELTRNKLTVLYFLNKLKVELTRDQIADVSVQHDLIPYFDLQSTVCELEEAGFLAAVPRTFGQAYSLTERGLDALNMFCERIPQSLRDDLDTYADACRDELRKQTQYVSSIEKAEQGGYWVTLKAMERDSTIFVINLLLADAHSANLAAARWPENTDELYREIIAKLLSYKDN